MNVRRARRSLAIVAALAAFAVAADDPPPRVRVVADGEGFFRIKDAGISDAWPGPGVRAMEGQFGRIEDGAEDPAVFVRAADGSFERRAAFQYFVPVPDAVQLRNRFLAAAKAAADERIVAGTDSLLDRIVVAPDTAVPYVAPPPRPARWPGDDVRDPPPPGADLAAWAPAQFPFVRFRTVEAAYRFCDVADRIGARLLAASGDGRDYGTLRWALHDLVLPEVWNANPMGEKGVGECALIVAASAGDATAPARPEVALLLRITDPSLHAMETASGLGYAAMPEHAWRPADDPEPATRAPSNFRKTIGDVEVVATSERLLDLVTRPRKGASLADGPAWRAARAAPPVPDEAFLLVLSAEARLGGVAGDASDAGAATLRGVREARGLAALWERWTGLVRGPAFAATWPGPSRAFPASLANLLSVRCVTDAKGGDVTAEFADDRAAESARAALEPAAVPLASGGAPCRANRRDLFPLARVEPDAKDLAERAFVVLGWRPVCPCGGTYTVHPITHAVSCTAHGNDAKPLADPPAPKPLIRDLRREGAAVRFRVPIAW